MQMREDELTSFMFVCLYYLFCLSDSVLQIHIYIKIYLKKVHPSRINKSKLFRQGKVDTTFSNWWDRGKEGRATSQQSQKMGAGTMPPGANGKT